MSSDGTPMSDRLNTRFSTPAPELDDHRPRRPSEAPAPTRAQPPARIDLPILEVQGATPRASVMDPNDLLHVDDALRNLPIASPGQSIARDFENAISDGSEDGSDVQSPVVRRGSARRDTAKRGGRPKDIRQHDRSRDTSSSRSTSPANSVEAFAEPRRRQRANTVGSLPESIDLQRYKAAGSYTDTRRPTLTDISVPAALQSRAGTYEDAERNASFVIDDEPGKTYKIDFEELEEFVALCKQGKVPTGAISSSTSEASGEKKVFHDQRQSAGQQDVQNAPLNGENFYEKSNLGFTSSAETAAEGNKKPGPAPMPVQDTIDRFTFFSTDVQKPKFAKSLADYTADGTKFQELFDVGPEGGVWWLDVMNPTQAELDVIASAFQIHRLTKEDIEMQEPREKVELFRDYYFVCFRSFNMNRLSEDFLDPIHLYIIVTADGVLSFSYTANPHAHNVRRRISKVGDFVSLGPDYICYALIDDIVDSFAPTIRDVEAESENIEDSVFIARDSDLGALLRQIGEARKRVLNMMRLLGGKADVIKGFAKRCNEQYDITPRGDIGLYLGDIQDHVVTMMSNLGHIEKMLSRSHANYLAQLSVDHLLKGNSTNKALAKITVFATILVPLNLITGLFGMNVHVPGMDKPGYGWFGGIIGAIALFVTCALLTARKMKLI
ncbi:hypothetical protein PMZ80_005729 [Knufia obscura]|uniref:Uncharacterized protein n=2 Tax=Knufia TaxID=430999 RepID=A0AAN8INQ5_9EURO|nr:hypothetical protein PMZ80_005729 [Knufia obscura]KAK5954397.1 hypothetical protein OHC33_004119 [Knufia fluminis]